VVTFFILNLIYVLMLTGGQQWPMGLEKGTLIEFAMGMPSASPTKQNLGEVEQALKHIKIWERQKKDKDCKRSWERAQELEAFSNQILPSI
jgi:hypothetical protein